MLWAVNFDPVLAVKFSVPWIELYDTIWHNILRLSFKLPRDSLTIFERYYENIGVQIVGHRTIFSATTTFQNCLPCYISYRHKFSLVWFLKPLDVYQLSLVFVPMSHYLWIKTDEREIKENCRTLSWKTKYRRKSLEAKSTGNSPLSPIITPSDPVDQKKQ